MDEDGMVFGSVYGVDPAMQGKKWRAGYAQGLRDGERRRPLSLPVDEHGFVRVSTRGVQTIAVWTGQGWHVVYHADTQGDQERGDGADG